MSAASASSRLATSRSSTTTFRLVSTCWAATGQTTAPGCRTSTWACGSSSGFADSRACRRVNRASRRGGSRLIQVAEGRTDRLATARRSKPSVARSVCCAQAERPQRRSCCGPPPSRRRSRNPGRGRRLRAAALAWGKGFRSRLAGDSMTSDEREEGIRCQSLWTFTAA